MESHPLAGHDPGGLTDIWRRIAPVAVCITLTERPDRTDLAAVEFERVGLSPMIRYYVARKDRTPGIPRPGIRGCWESHRAVAAIGLRAGLDRLLVFEDDVDFGPNFDASVLEGLRAEICDARMPRGWRALLLGHTPLLAVPARASGGLWRTASLCLHAYVISREGMLWLSGKPFDSQFCRLPLDWRFAMGRGLYAYHPLIAIQRPVASDNPKAVESIALDSMITDRDVASVWERVVYGVSGGVLVLVTLGVVLAVALGATNLPRPARGTVVRF